jgi:Flp pilus assembly protein CpaB
MLKRLMGTGINLVVLVVSIGVFLLAFVLLSAMGAAQRPPTVTVLSATRDLSIGEVITHDTLAEKTVFEDDNAALYIPADEAEAVVGGIVAQPIFAGQPVFRSAIVAKAAEETRLSAVLAQYPGYSLFPLPLDAMNLVSPDAASFLPGDLVGVTVVIASRPHEQSTPTPMPEIMVVPANPQPAATPSSAESALAEALSRTFPPLAKDLFPMGVRVISVQGLPVQTTDESGETSQSTFNDFSQTRMLILLVPNEAREVLALALQQGDKLVVSLMARGDEDPTAGFTYWDFEDQFEADREDVLKGGR